MANLLVHYGEEDSQGAYHTVNGKRYPLEIHQILYQDKWGSLLNALNYDDGVLILCVLYEVAPGPSAGIPQLFFDSLPSITQANSTRVIPGAAVANLLPNVNGRYFWYKSNYGIVPLCQETVNYLVFDEVLPVRRDQLQQLRNSGLRSPKGKLLVTIPPEPLQARRGRPIYMSPPANGYHSNNLGYTSAYSAA